MQKRVNKKKDSMMVYYHQPDGIPSKGFVDWRSVLESGSRVLFPKAVSSSLVAGVVGFAKYN